MEAAAPLVVLEWEMSDILPKVPAGLVMSWVKSVECDSET
jgi:hypothetical protein